MEITLKQLNESFNSLSKLANYDRFGKDQVRLKYRLSRTWKSAKSEIKEMQLSIQDLMNSYGIEAGQPITQIPGEIWKEFEARQKDLLEGIKVELWGDPIELKEILHLECLTPADLADLDWLFIDDFGDPEGLAEDNKAQGAQI